MGKLSNTIQRIKGQFLNKKQREQVTDTANRASYEDYIDKMKVKEDVGREGIIDRDWCKKANERLLRYANDKRPQDERVKETNEWYMRRHWRIVKALTIDTKDEPEPTTAYLFNSMVNKHADAMDMYPESVFLPRSKDDEKVASQLCSVIPAMKEDCKYLKVYSRKWWDKLITGTGVTGDFWDFHKNGGAGGLEVRRISILNLFYKSNIEDIQKSPYVFEVELVEKEQLVDEYPFLKDEKISDSFRPVQFESDTTNIGYDEVTVIHAWYKKNGKVHYCKYCNEIVIYASENDPRFMNNGFYFHGEYPFHIDVLYPIQDHVAGMGYVDIFKSCQMYIDKLEQAMLLNTISNARPRAAVSESAGVNEDEFCDVRKPLVHVDNLNERTFVPLQTSQLGGAHFNMLDHKIQELKETSANKDFNQGSTAAGVNSGAAIRALQESGNKPSRDMINMSYQIENEQDAQILNLIRQFMALPQYYRIVGEENQIEYKAFDNTELLPREMQNENGEIYYKLPIFDIKVKAQRKSPFSTLEQNERIMSMFSCGMFNPDLAPQAIAAIEGMTFEGKEEMLVRIRKNGDMQQLLMAMQQKIMQYESLLGIGQGAPAGIGGEAV